MSASITSSFLSFVVTLRTHIQTATLKRIEVVWNTSCAIRMRVDTSVAREVTPNIVLYHSSVYSEVGFGHSFDDEFTVR